MLQTYVGISLRDLNKAWQESGLFYSEEYDAFYNYTSDFGPGTFHCTSGKILGDTVYLYAEHGEGNGSVSRLTLRESDGKYLIQALQKMN